MNFFVECKIIAKMKIERNNKEEEEKEEEKYELRSQSLYIRVVIFFFHLSIAFSYYVVAIYAHDRFFFPPHFCHLLCTGCDG